MWRGNIRLWQGKCQPKLKEYTASGETLKRSEASAPRLLDTEGNPVLK